MKHRLEHRVTKVLILGTHIGLEKDGDALLCGPELIRNGFLSLVRNVDPEATNENHTALRPQLAEVLYNISCVPTCRAHHLDDLGLVVRLLRAQRVAGGGLRVEGSEAERA